MLVQLARDLGEDFYTKYWPRTVSLLCETVSHPDFVVIEAAFNTLSWLLKYLARPLVTSLPTTFIQLSPLLGKDRQKQHVRRFASEVFAFLLRRVKNPDEIVEVMLSDLGDNEEYSEAVTNVFIEGMKAPARTLHSKALGIFSALLKVAHSGTDTSLQIPDSSGRKFETDFEWSARADYL
jgi:U3 small nucleolar RNA-associated protein 20